MLIAFFRAFHDSLNNFLNESAQAMKAPIPLYSRKVLIALSLCFFMLLSKRNTDIPLFLVSSISRSIFLGTISLYGLSLALGMNSIFHDIGRFQEDLQRVYRQESLFWPFVEHYILFAPYRCLASFLQAFINPAQNIVMSHTALKLCSEMLGFLILYYGAASFSSSLAFISVPLLKTVLLNQLILCTALQLLAFSGRPDFWNTALDSFIAMPTVIEKINFLAMHLLLYPFSNFIHMLRFPQNAQFFERPPVAPPRDDAERFPGNGRELNPDPGHRIFLHRQPRQPLNPEEIRGARLNHLAPNIPPH